MDPIDFDQTHDNHSERIENLETQIANLLATNEALNETLKRLMLKIDSGEPESPMVSAR
jgi:uncharacterized coiled-coil protein SlyX